MVSSASFFALWPPFCRYCSVAHGTPSTQVSAQARANDRGSGFCNGTVIVFRVPEFGRLDDLRLHGSERRVLADRVEDSARRRLLRIRVRIDTMAVLGSAVVANLIKEIDIVIEPLRTHRGTPVRDGAGA